MKPVIYQLVVRYFGNTSLANVPNGSIQDNGCGKFDDISPAALSALGAMGVTHVWLTGCLRQATLTDYSAHGMPADDPDVVKGIAGSLYSVRDYYDVCPDYASDIPQRLAEFTALVNRIHAAGMKCLLDFVPNHVARGYSSIVKPGFDFGAGDNTGVFFDQANSFFYLVTPPGQRLRLSRPPHWSPPGFAFGGEFPREDGSPGRPPKASGNNITAASVPADAWYEAAKLNYGFNFVDSSTHYTPRPRTWDAMDDIIAYWQSKGVDGFRCDFAHYVPAEFWSFLIANARRRVPGAFFIAEAYPWNGSGDPVTDRRQLVDAGFDGIYYDGVYNALKEIYQGHAGQDDYDSATGFPPIPRNRLVSYLENHDEIRIAAPVDPSQPRGQSGFGSPAAAYQLAPLQALYSNGPFLILNGQEVGERGGGNEGFNDFAGRTTFFDYWGMPDFAKWVNGHAYDGGQLSREQRDLRKFYTDLHLLCQDPSVVGDGYWGLKYYNHPGRFADCPADLYSFARFADHSGRMLVVVANFRPGSPAAGRIRLPSELAAAAGLNGPLDVKLVLDRGGRQDVPVTQSTAGELASQGFTVSIPDQSAHVFVVSA